jgi:hypothetical protein
MAKIISMFLPQFHEIEENDEWWGKGYTEWVAVKGAKKYNDTHYQPRIPLNNNYYNLLDKKTMLWQAELMKKYGIYGQSIYHYYFENGRKILEKPAENLLKWKDVEMPFCFTWANESWVRTWSTIKGVNWNSNIENKKGGDGVLLKQNYGSIDDWKNHFLYLLDFFKDDRYIKIDNKPVFIIYKPLDIYCIKDMTDLWNELARKNGFSGVYLIGVNSLFENASAMLQLEANNVGMYLDREVNFDKVCEQIITSAAMSDGKVFLCGTPGYDDSPRRGKRGSIFKECTPELFYKQMKHLVRLSHERNNEFLFINAWNEWGEGMYLEPDSVYEYKYLDAVYRATIDGESFGKKDAEEYMKLIESGIKKRYIKQEKRINQLNYFEDVLEKMLNLYESGLGLEEKLKDMDCKEVAIYGLGKIGKHVVNQLSKTDIHIIYGIDKDAEDIKEDFPIYKVEESLPQVDIIIVTTPKADFKKLETRKYRYITVQSLLDNDYGKNKDTSL